MLVVFLYLVVCVLYVCFDFGELMYGMYGVVDGLLVMMYLGVLCIS